MASNRQRRSDSPPPTVINITEVTVTTSEKKATITLTIDDKRVRIPVRPEVKAHFEDQFSRPNPSAQQKKRFATLMNLMRAAYQKGLEDGSA